MSNILVAGMGISAVIGLLHAVYVYRQGAQETDQGRALVSFGRRAYYALWTFFLWLLLGPYALLFWSVSVVAYLLYRLARGLARPIVRRTEAASGLSGHA
jgi:hypothetical protein